MSQKVIKNHHYRPLCIARVLKWSAFRLLPFLSHWISRIYSLHIFIFILSQFKCVLLLFLYISVSQTTSNTTSSGSTSTVSGNSLFSSASGADEVPPTGQILPTPNLRIFSFSELKIATRNFRGDTVLGEGGFGKVYKGWLDEKVNPKNGTGSVVAVKKLNDESMQGFQEWQVYRLGFSFNTHKVVCILTFLGCIWLPVNVVNVMGGFG